MHLRDDIRWEFNIRKQEVGATNSARTNFLANRIVNIWNSLPATVGFNSLAAIRGQSNVQICLHSCRVIVLDVFFLLLLCFISYILIMSAQFCAILLFLWTPVSARILALVLQLYERNKLKLKTEMTRLW